MRREQILRLRRVLAFVLAGVVLCLSIVNGWASSANSTLPPNMRLWLYGPTNEDEARARAALEQIDYSMTDSSLAVREQVDFLLTPALLVQEAVSDDVVLTYPEE